MASIAGNLQPDVQDTGPEGNHIVRGIVGGISRSGTQSETIFLHRRLLRMGVGRDAAAAPVAGTDGQRSEDAATQTRMRLQGGRHERPYGPGIPQERG